MFMVVLSLIQVYDIGSRSFWSPTKTSTLFMRNFMMLDLFKRNLTIKYVLKSPRENGVFQCILNLGIVDIYTKRNNKSN